MLCAESEHGSSKGTGQMNFGVSSYFKEYEETDCVGSISSKGNNQIIIYSYNPASLASVCLENVQKGHFDN